MIKQNSIALIIPCYNEEKGLITLLPKVPNFIDEVIIVNNNSTDKTVEIAKSFNCTVLNETIKGYGAAYKCGFKYVAKDIIEDFIEKDPVKEKFQRFVNFFEAILSYHKYYGGKN